MMTPAQRLSELHRIREAVCKLDDALGHIDGIDEDDESTLDRVCNNLCHAKDELKGLLKREQARNNARIAAKGK